MPSMSPRSPPTNAGSVPRIVVVTVQTMAPTHTHTTYLHALHAAARHADAIAELLPMSEEHAKTLWLWAAIDALVEKGWLVPK